MTSSELVDNEGVLAQLRTNCPITDDPGSVIYHDLRDRFYGAPGVWSVLQCSECGHLWLNPAPLPEEMWKLYREYYTHCSVSEGRAGFAQTVRAVALHGLLYASGYTKVARTRTERFAGRALYRIPSLRDAVNSSIMFLTGPRTGTLLDVGCGTGEFLSRMRSLGWDPTGIDSDPGVVRQAKERFGINVLLTPAEKLELPLESFDAITLDHSVEHLHDPVAALKRCAGVLRPGGLMVIKTPNVEGLGHSRYGRSWMHLDPPRHLQLFSQDSLLRCIRRAGLEAKSWRTLCLGAAKVHLVSREIQRHKYVGSAHPAPVPTMRGRLFRLEEDLLRSVRKNAGEELVLIAGKVPRHG